MAKAAQKQPSKDDLARERERAVEEALEFFRRGASLAKRAFKTEAPTVGQAAACASVLRADADEVDVLLFAGQAAELAGKHGGTSPADVVDLFEILYVDEDAAEHLESVAREVGECLGPVPFQDLLEAYWHLHGEE